VFTP
jgi:hypothetical protein